MLGFIEETNRGYGTARVILHHAFRGFLGRSLSDQDAEPYGSAFVLIAATPGKGNHFLNEKKRGRRSPWNLTDVNSDGLIRNHHSPNQYTEA